MLKLSFVIWVSLVAMMALSMDVVSGQTYPNKPVRILTAEVGGSTDFASRLIAQGLTASLGQ